MVDLVLWVRPFFGLLWALSRPKRQVCGLILEIQLLFPKFGVGGLYSCDMLKVGSFSHYVYCLSVLLANIPFILA